VDAYTKAGRSTEKAEPAQGAEKSGGPRVVIQHLYIRNAKVNIGSSLSDQTIGATLPDIHLTDIGSQKNGATPGEVAEKIIDALEKTVNTTVASVDTSKVLGEAKKQFAVARGGIEEKAKGAAGGIGKIFGK
jgi:hypothetical protein